MSNFTIVHALRRISPRRYGRRCFFKYFSCAVPECLGNNFDVSDPGTQAFIKAQYKKALKDAGAAASVATIISPIGVTGTAAGAVGTGANILSGMIDDPASAAGKEVGQRILGEYLKQVLHVPPSVVDRAVATVDLAGGWDVAVEKAKTEINKMTSQDQ